MKTLGAFGHSNKTVIFFLINNGGAVLAVVAAIDVELQEDNHILKNGSEGAKQPGQIMPNVINVVAVQQNAASISHIAENGEEEKEQ